MRSIGWCLTDLRLLLVLSLMPLAGGCSVDDHVLLGPGHVQYYETPSAWICRIDCWGALLITNPADRGVIFGHSTCAYVYAKSNGSTQLPSAQSGTKEWLRQFRDAGPAAGVEATRARAGIAGNATPVSFLTSGYGLSIHLNENDIGIAVGARIRELLCVPREFQGLIATRMDLAQPANDRAEIMETKQ